VTIGQPVKIAVTLRVRGSAMIFVLHPGDQLWEYIAGGAGYGDPLERDPAAVLADVLDGKIASAEDYRVVLTAEWGRGERGEDEGVAGGARGAAH
jgi:N-methylhydantoinase B/oxoprolinase/acetone carboxylase alpha subunit